MHQDGLPQSIAALVAEVAALGVAGINMEDGAQASALLADKIAASSIVLGNAPLFINVRNMKV